ncbi:MAG: prolyl aminopeptidase, partial [Cyanobacteria bacterium]|nr:prolyl aminopeptidase [Cyanobacteriota bacterium]
RVSGLILRGIFLCRPEEILWFYQSGCHQLYPDRWESFIKPVPEHQRHEMISAYYQLLTHPDETIQLSAAKAWSAWEGSTVKLIPNSALIADFESPQKALAMARIECHYFIHQSFFTPETELLNPQNIEKIRHIPTWIIHGRYDVVCPVKNAWDLHQAFPEAILNIIPDAGHAYDEPGILNALIQATQDAKLVCAH